MISRKNSRGFATRKIKQKYFHQKATVIILKDICKMQCHWLDPTGIKNKQYPKTTEFLQYYEKFYYTCPGLDINVCLIPVKTDVGQVDLVSRLSDGTSEKNDCPTF
jgi:hypothetical protein